MRTCTNLVERRSGAGITTGAGERSGKYESLCGRPVEEGQTYCSRCQTTLDRQHDKAHARYHQNHRAQGRTEEEIRTFCPICKRS